MDPAEVVAAPIGTDQDMTTWSGKLKGKVVLVGGVTEVRPLFTPLGRRYNSLRGLNETVANIVGADLGALLAREYPLEQPPSYVTAAPLGAGNGAQPSTMQDGVDFNAEMHALRLQVDMLLAGGRVDEAEAAMDAKRRFFADHGICIREINQAEVHLLIYK